MLGSPVSSRALLDTTKFGSVEDAVDGYIAWVQAHLAAGKAACSEAHYIVWTPQAGIGDGAYSFATAFAHAFRSSRVLMVNWKLPLSDKSDGTMSWRDVLAPPYDWDWEANACSQILKADGVDPAVAYMVDMDFIGHNAHVVAKEREQQQSHPDTGLEAMEVAVLQRYFLPSLAVQKIMEPVLPKLAGRYVISAVVRTGWTEDTLNSKFLNEGDEERFAACIVAAKHQLKGDLAAGDTGNTQSGVTVLVLSDNQKVLQRLRADSRLQSSPSFEVVFGVDSSADGSGALSHVNTNSSSVERAGVYRSFAEWFLLARSQITFLTSNSLYGDSATRRGGDAVVRRYAINKGSCESDTRMQCKERMEFEKTSLHDSCPAFLQSKPLESRLDHDPWIHASRTEL